MSRFDIPQSIQPSWTTRREGGAVYVNVLPRTEFLPDLAQTKVLDIPLATGIPSVEWTSGVLSVKYSSRTAWGGGAQVQVIVQNIAIIPEEPSTTFVEGTNMATSLWAAGGATNKLETIAFTLPIGPQLRVLLRVTGPTAAAGIVGVTLTVDLVGRTA